MGHPSGPALCLTLNLVLTLTEIEAMLARDHAAQDGSVSRHLAVDPGCGTGLVGAALRSRCHGRLTGCDLSGQMVEEARKKLGVFDELEACDCVAYLRRRVARASADLLVAADVLIYLRDLADLFSAAAAALRPGGLFVFSTELATDSECGGVPPDGRGWAEPQGETTVLAVPQLATLASWGWPSRPLAALQAREEPSGRAGRHGRLRCDREARPTSADSAAYNSQVFIPLSVCACLSMWLRPLAEQP